VKECKNLFVVNNNEDAFYQLREEFNSTKDKFRKATLFIYLNRHCFNGLCRYNAGGKFNVAFGKYAKSPYFPEKEFVACIEIIKKFKIYNKDFRGIFEMVEPGDLVYADPPYVPLSTSANFSRYTKTGFTLEDQVDLAKCAEKASKKGATVVISNHYNLCSLQIYSELYKGQVAEVIDVTRTISVKTDVRNSAKEVIFVYQ
jgi:DNA adenine methylase